MKKLFTPLTFIEWLIEEIKVTDLVPEDQKPAYRQMLIPIRNRLHQCSDKDLMALSETIGHFTELKLELSDDYSPRINLFKLFVRWQALAEKEKRLHQDVELWAFLTDIQPHLYAIYMRWFKVPDSSKPPFEQDLFNNAIEYPISLIDPPTDIKKLKRGDVVLGDVEL